MMPDVLLGNGSFRSYSRSEPGSFRSYSLSVRSFRPDFRGGSFRPNFGGSFQPTLFFTRFIGIATFFWLARFILFYVDSRKVFLASPFIKRSFNR